MTTSPEAVSRLETWVHSLTQEAVSLSFDGRAVRMERGGQVKELKPDPLPPFDEAAELERLRQQVKSMYQWTPLEVADWRDHLVSEHETLMQAQQAFLKLGFPLKLWQDIDALRLAQHYEPSGQDGRLQFAGTSLSAEVAEADQPAPTDGLSRLVVHPDELPWRDSLLFHATPEIKSLYEEQYKAVRLAVSPPTQEADAAWEPERRKLHAQGFVRLTTRAAGRLWLPPLLEPFRAVLEANERPLMRLSADPTQAPKPWQSQVAGVPYRPKGTPWPLSGEATPRPMLFLAQLNLADLNPGGQALPDFPSAGLLQFFILNTMFYGADAMFDPKLRSTRLFQVIYHPQVVQDETQLDQDVPALLADDQGGTLDQTPFLFAPKPLRAVLLTGLPDHEPISGADDGSKRLLNLPSNYWDGTQPEAGQIVQALYELNPDGHKLDGYPNFTQGDPRQAGDDWVLLLQLDSDERLGLQWGDVGTANFFIRPEDLKARDFSRVMYNWDCG